MEKSTLTCATAGYEGEVYSVLVVGESWAVGNREFPELPDAVSGRLHGRKVKACTIGFSGRNSKKLYRELNQAYPKASIRGVFGGKAPDSVIVLNGVNDVIQHVGEDAYATNTAKIVDYFDPVSTVQVVTIPRVNEATFRAAPQRMVKRWLQANWFDHGRMVSNDDYRRALAAARPDIRQIEYDRFSGPYEANPDRFEPDGVHLTRPQFHVYGQFLGEQVLLRNTDVFAGKDEQPDGGTAKPFKAKPRRIADQPA